MDWIKVKNPAAPAVRREAEKIGGGECEDHVGTYVIPFLCQWSDGTWQNAKTRRHIEAAVIGWRGPKRNQR